MSKEIKNGPFEEYDTNGRLRVKGTYKDGKLEGLYEEYYSSGRLHTRCTFKNGKLDTYNFYYENGRLWRKCSFKNGKLDGPYEIYHKSGKLAEKTFYKDDKEITEEEYNRFTQNETTPVKVAAHSRTIKALREKEANHR